MNLLEMELKKRHWKWMFSVSTFKYTVNRILLDIHVIEKGISIEMSPQIWFPHFYSSNHSSDKSFYIEKLSDEN